MTNHLRADGRVRGASAEIFDLITATILQFCQLSGFSRTLTYQLLDDGELESIYVGGRRYVVIDSYKRLVERRQATASADVEAARQRRRNAKAKAEANAALSRRMKLSVDQKASAGSQSA